MVSHPRALRNPLRRLFSHANAVGNSNAVITVACDKHPRHGFEARFQFPNTLSVPDSILSHRTRPAIDLEEQRLGRDRENFSQLLTHLVYNRVIALGQHRLIPGAAQKTTKQRERVRNAVWKLVPHPRSCQQLAALAFRYKKAESEH